jgi:hypothetical protein
MMQGFLLAILILVNIGALAGGLTLGVWASRKIPLTLSLANANPTAVTLMMWNVRVFVFLVCLVSVTAPFAFASQAITGD